jgi:uncharacterized membrane protein YcaP (DUF421 family)
MDWSSIFSFTVSPWEMILRGTLMYWFLFGLFRWLVRRRLGTMALGDLLVLVLIADAAQNAMAGDYRSFPEGAILVTTIVGWNVALDWAAFHVKALRRFAEPPPLPLVWRGRVIRKNLKDEYLSVDELMAQLRQKGVDDVRKVKAAYLESDGELSVLQYDRQEEPPSDKAAKAGVK